MTAKKHSSSLTTTYKPYESSLTDKCRIRISSVNGSYADSPGIGESSYRRRDGFHFLHSRLMTGP
ncbi:MAG: hypothetical protein WCY44_11835 [Sphaerochaetaceae bacterium]